VVVEVILERVTNIAMSGSDIGSVVEFEDLAESTEVAPTAVGAVVTG
jgi:tartronate-semialdehyde synthase